MFVTLPNLAGVRCREIFYAYSRRSKAHTQRTLESCSRYREQFVDVLNGVGVPMHPYSYTNHHKPPKTICPDADAGEKAWNPPQRTLL